MQKYNTMKQTPLQNLIKWVADKMSLYPDDPSLSERGSYDAYLNILNEAHKLLPYEQECIENAVTYGNRQDFYDGSETLGNKYFAENYTIPQIEFDAKKVAEELYESWGKYLQVTFGVVKKVQLKSILIKHLDNNASYTQTQRQQILNELNKI